MPDSVFIINNRFEVNPGKHEVLDTVTNQCNHLEPRLMRLLCLLVEQRGKVVSRELIIRDIWNDYPGANDGLNQAISFLRKELADNNKEIIKTLPKAGYQFSGLISEVTELPLPANSKKKDISQWLSISAIVLVVVFITWYFATGKGSNGSPVTDEQVKMDKEQARWDSIHQAKTLQSQDK